MTFPTVVKRPIDPFCELMLTPSVNQSAPSGPVTMSCGRITPT